MNSGIISAIVNATIAAVLLLFVVRLPRWRSMGKQVKMARPLGVTLGNGSCVCRESDEDRIDSSMKAFSNASFPPETIAIMKVALDRAVASLPDGQFFACPGHSADDPSHR